MVVREDHSVLSYDYTIQRVKLKPYSRIIYSLLFYTDLLVTQIREGPSILSYNLKGFYYTKINYFFHRLSFDYQFSTLSFRGCPEFNSNQDSITCLRLFYPLHEPYQFFLLRPYLLYINNIFRSETKFIYLTAFLLYIEHTLIFYLEIIQFLDFDNYLSFSVN